MRVVVAGRVEGREAIHSKDAGVTPAAHMLHLRTPIPNPSPQGGGEVSP
jgi:hypothetical protein